MIHSEYLINISNDADDAASDIDSVRSVLDLSDQNETRQSSWEGVALISPCLVFLFGVVFMGCRFGKEYYVSSVWHATSSIAGVEERRLGPSWGGHTSNSL